MMTDKEFEAMRAIAIALLHINAPIPSVYIDFLNEAMKEAVLEHDQRKNNYGNKTKRNQFFT